MHGHNQLTGLEPQHYACHADIKSYKNTQIIRNGQTSLLKYVPLTTCTSFATPVVFLDLENKTYLLEIT